MTPIEVIGEAAKLIEDKRRWTHGALARDARGSRVEASDPQAVRWCVAGALEKVTSSWSEQERAEELLTESVGQGVTFINDTWGRLAVESLFGTALEPEA